MKVLVTKLSSRIENPDMANGYWVRGLLVRPLQVGDICEVLREENSIKKTDGWFTTSPIVSINEGDGRFHTINSSYSIVYL